MLRSTEPPPLPTYPPPLPAMPNPFASDTEIIPPPLPKIGFPPPLPQPTEFARRPPPLPRLQRSRGAVELLFAGIEWIFGLISVIVGLAVLATVPLLHGLSSARS